MSVGETVVFEKACGLCFDALQTSLDVCHCYQRKCQTTAEMF